MSKEAIEKIKSAEDKAREIVMKAEQDALDAEKNAELKNAAALDALYEDIKKQRALKIAEAKSKIDDIIKEARSSAENEGLRAVEGYKRQMHEAACAAMDIILK